MKKTEKRNVEVKYCDFCKEETGHLDRCAVCKKEMCNKDGNKAHTAYSTEIYRYKDGQRLVGYGNNICKDCAGETFDGTIQELLDGMMSEITVIIKA
ncbi:hypothetical protein KKH35_02740 [Patescibacteria group bacterium]|nr:hypothetical protein [Patescibacteria group bacterium]